MIQIMQIINNSDSKLTSLNETLFDDNFLDDNNNENENQETQN